MDSVFLHSPRLVSVELSSLTNLGLSAFRGCAYLKSFNLAYIRLAKGLKRRTTYKTAKRFAAKRNR